MPKFNMYQSLHTTVIGPEGKPVEIQIRTHEMHRRAEYGVAAHWKYKDDPNAAPGRADGARPQRHGLAAPAARLAAGDRPTRASSSTRCASRSTRRRSTSSRPRATSSRCRPASTPVDFAYAVHTEVGHRTMGARVNGRLVPLESTLDNGDVVEIFTSKADGAGPSRDWLTFVKSPRARNKIRQWFTKERREEAIEHGKDAHRQGDAQAEPAAAAAHVARVARRRWPPRCATPTSPASTPPSARATSAPAASVQRLVQSLGGEEGAEEDLAEVTTPDAAAPSAHRRPRRRGPRRGQDSGSSSPGAARPVPGDPIIGFVTRGERRLRAPQPTAPTSPACGPQPDRIIEVDWAPTAGERVPRADPGRGAGPQPPALRRHPGAVRQPRQHPRGHRVDLAGPGGDLALRLRDGRPGHLDHVLSAVRRIDGVFDVYRVTGAAPTR